ncbi:hypothetical protein FISHEDRAFT_56135 [Fistulina hepatica ATCC 64428]|uniref:Uncharacterized protein n=1 Tax=Fistulina hepatica ATCC 64428 TaxID=1128425 RepID=A0A0D7AKP5_9AGAR|nr:hypothetical protein FISHEDRAFT_56135 [Fistulina hepatica ATCC 64428]
MAADRSYTNVETSMAKTDTGNMCINTGTGSDTDSGDEADIESCCSDAGSDDKSANVNPDCLPSRLRTQNPAVTPQALASLSLNPSLTSAPLTLPSPPSPALVPSGPSTTPNSPRLRPRPTHLTVVPFMFGVDAVRDESRYSPCVHPHNHFPTYSTSRWQTTSNDFGSETPLVWEPANSQGELPDLQAHCAPNSDSDSENKVAAAKLRHKRAALRATRCTRRLRQVIMQMKCESAMRARSEGVKRTKRNGGRRSRFDGVRRAKVDGISRSKHVGSRHRVCDSPGGVRKLHERETSRI